MGTGFQSYGMMVFQIYFFLSPKLIWFGLGSWDSIYQLISNLRMQKVIGHTVSDSLT